MNKTLKNILFIIVLLVFVAGGVYNFLQINHLNMVGRLFSSEATELGHSTQANGTGNGLHSEDIKTTEGKGLNRQGSSRTVLAWEGLLFSLIFFSSIIFVTCTVARLSKNRQRKGTPHGQQNLS